MRRLSREEQKTLDKSLRYWRRRANRINDNISWDELIEAYRTADRSIRDELYDLMQRLPAQWTRSDFYKYNRMNVLSDRINNIIRNLSTLETTFVRSQITSRIVEGYSIFSNDIIQVNKETLTKLAGTNWSGVNFSNRIWQDKQALVNTINSKIVSGINMGTSIPEMVKGVRETLNVNYAKAQTLVRTESIAYFNIGAEERYKDAGIKEEIWISAHDEKVCPICQELDGKVYDTGEAPKVAHPNCRCTIIPKTDLIIEEYKKSRGE